MALINKDMNHLSLLHQCKLMDIPRSSFYYEPLPESAQNLSLMRRIDELHLAHPYYGVLRLREELSTAAAPVNEKRIRRLMRLMGIETIYCKPNLSKPCPNSLKYPYLLRGLDINRPNQVWSTDITYIPMKRGFMYLCAVIDWYSRCILSWKLSNTLTAVFCVEALHEAIETHGVPGIVNTDQGSQFSSDMYTVFVAQHGISLSMDGKGRATDNVMIERFWRSLKYEKIYLHAYEDGLELYVGISEYMHFYNEQRKHQSLGRNTPKAVYTKQIIPNTTTTLSALST